MIYADLHGKSSVTEDRFSSNVLGLLLLLPARDLLVVEYVGRFLWLHNRMTAWSQKSLLHGKWQSKAAAMSPLQAVIWTYCMRSVLYCIVQSTFIHETNVDKWKGRG